MRAFTPTAKRVALVGAAALGAMLLAAPFGLIPVKAWLLAKVFGWTIDRPVRGHLARRPAIDWRALHNDIRREVDGYSVFLETQDGRIVPLASASAVGGEVVALVVTWRRDVEFMSPEEPARELVSRLSARVGLDAFVLLSRDPDTFAGYYVRVAPRRP